MEISDLDTLEIFLDGGRISGSRPHFIVRKLFVHQEFEFIEADARGGVNHIYKPKLKYLFT